MKTPLVLWGLALFFLLVYGLLPQPHHVVETVQVQNSLGKSLRLVVFCPESLPDGPGAGAILFQPVNNPPEFSRPLALELVRRGFVVLTFDWAGSNPEENRQVLRADMQEMLGADALAAFAYLKSRTDVDAARIVVAGHSVGANVAVDLAIEQPEIVAAACIGMAREAEGVLPSNVLWCAGLYDEFWPPSAMADAFRASTGHEPDSLAKTQMEVAGTQRGLAISPTSDHFTELFDRRLQRVVAEWFIDSVGLEGHGHGYWVEWRYLAYTVAWALALAAGLLTARRFIAGNKSLIRALPALALAAVLALDHALGNYASRFGDAVVYLVLLVLLTGISAGLSAEVFHSRCRLLARVACVGWASLLLTLIVGAVPSYIQQPRFVAFIPEFAVRHLLDWLYAYLLLYSHQLLFSSYSAGGLAVRGWVYLLLLIELAGPGLLLRSVSRLVRRPPRRDRPSRRVPLKEMAVLAILLIGLAALLWLRLGQGYLTRESILAALRFIVRFAALPTFFFIVLWRVSTRFWPYSAS